MNDNDPTISGVNPLNAMFESKLPPLRKKYESFSKFEKEDAIILAKIKG